MLNQCHFRPYKAHAFHCCRLQSVSTKLGTRSILDIFRNLSDGQSLNQELINCTIVEYMGKNMPLMPSVSAFIHAHLGRSHVRLEKYLSALCEII